MVEVSDVINVQSTAHSVHPVLVSAIIRHESAAVERRLITPLPSMRPGFLANAAEYGQSIVQGDDASIGPGQMKLYRARELEEMGYVTARENDHERRMALLGDETSVEYVAGMLHYLSDQLNTMDGYSSLSIAEQTRMLAIAYNWGWTDYFTQKIEELGFEGFIEESGYDNDTLDEYLRWYEEQ